MPESLTFCGRTFRADELELMRQMAREFSALGVTEIARTVCELLEWKRPARSRSRFRRTVMSPVLGSVTAATRLGHALTKLLPPAPIKNATPRVFLATGNGLTVRRLGADHLWRRIPPM